MVRMFWQQFLYVALFAVLFFTWNHLQGAFGPPG
jgi:hypothetical protein